MFDNAANPAGLGFFGKKKKNRNRVKAPLAKQRWTRTQKRQMPSIARRLPGATKGPPRPVEKKNKAPKAITPPVVQLPPASAYTPPQYIGTPADPSPQAMIDRIATGTDDGAAVDLSTDSQADATAPEGDITETDAMISDEVEELIDAAEQGDPEAMEGLGRLGYGYDAGLGSWFSKAARSVAPLLSTVPGAGGAAGGILNTIFKPKQAGSSPAPAPAPVAPVARAVVRKAAPAAKASTPGWVVPVVVSAAGLLAIIAISKALKS